VRVLVAPDKFKGTLTAAQAARAIARGWRRARPADAVEELPLADGGEGTMAALVAGLGGDVRTLAVEGPLGDPVEARYAIVERAGRVTGVVEMSAASGLQLLAPERRDPTRASTFGTGELLVSACRDGAEEVIVGLGGSASTDGGAGMAQAVGAGLFDASGRPLPRGGRALLDLARIDLGTLHPALRRTLVVAACDVDNPLTGPSGAAAVYAPQTGASAEDVVLLDRALGHLAAVVHRDLGIDVRRLPGAGAAGGLGAGLVAFLGARLRRGTEVVMDACGFHGRLAASDVIVTGEGALDEQSVRGKVVWAVAAEAHAAGVRAIALCGRASSRPDGLEVHALADRFGQERAVAEAELALEELAAKVARTSGTRSRPGSGAAPGAVSSGP
jgi:glycerate kinase